MGNLKPQLFNQKTKKGNKGIPRGQKSVRKIADRSKLKEMVP